MYYVNINRKKYIIKPSTVKYKKYDVFVDGKKLLSFGDNRYEQYKDRFGYYSKLNHLDKTRRESYRKRHGKTNKNNVNYPAYWSWHYLW